MRLFTNCAAFVNNILKKNDPVSLLGKLSGFAMALSLGISAYGFVTEFAFQFGYSSLLFNIFAYGIGSAVGLNTGFRLWNIVKIAAPNGIRFMISGKARAEIQNGSSPNLQPSEYFGIFVSLFAGLTYGGLTYLGCSHALPLSSLTSKITAGAIILTTSTIASGGLFANAWIVNLRNKTLFISPSAEKARFILECVCSVPAILGLGCTMTLGALGLIKNLNDTTSLNSNFKFAAYVIAFIGFLGEAPFAIKQGRLLGGNLYNVKKNSNSSHEKNSDGGKISTYTNKLSQLLYAGNAFCATYTDIGNHGIPLKTSLGVLSSYLSAISCMEDKNDVARAEEKQPLLPSTNDKGSPRQYQSTNFFNAPKLAFAETKETSVNASYVPSM